jgi:hypothetical protein
MLLTQNIGGIVTPVAIVIIAVIFAVYLLILRRMGWLGGKSNFYRCPNQECKKIFQIPIEVKDLSLTPPRTYLACPECGANLDHFLGSITEKTPETMEKNILRRKDFEPKPIEKKNEVRRVASPNSSQNKVMILRERATATKPEVKPIEKKAEVARVEKPIQSQKPIPIVRDKPPTAEPIADRKKTGTTDNSGCEYFFGYLAKRNVKHEGIPIRCLECPRSVDCILSN